MCWVAIQKDMLYIDFDVFMRNAFSDHQLGVCENGILDLESYLGLQVINAFGGFCK